MLSIDGILRTTLSQSLHQISSQTRRTVSREESRHFRINTIVDSRMFGIEITSKFDGKWTAIVRSICFERFVDPNAAQHRSSWNTDQYEENTTQDNDADGSDNAEKCSRSESIEISQFWAEASTWEGPTYTRTQNGTNGRRWCRYWRTPTDRSGTHWYRSTPALLAASLITFSLCCVALFSRSGLILTFL